VSPAFEAFLALLYTDRRALERFLADPAVEATRRGLAPLEVAALARVDREGLLLAARSFEQKRAARSAGGRR
jgi:hypothetical protein